MENSDSEIIFQKCLENQKKYESEDKKKLNKENVT
jgi:hypothetical protein